MAAVEQVKRLVRGPARRAVEGARRLLVPHYDELVSDRDRALRELQVAFESVTAAHQGIADLQAEQRALRERLDATLLLAEGNQARLGEVVAQLEPRLELLEDGLHEARRLNLRIAELTDVVTEIVLPLHHRDIDVGRVGDLAPDTQ
jgi:DNA repair exonuclease SbcCD ATPase subunit